MSVPALLGARSIPFAGQAPAEGIRGELKILRTRFSDKALSLAHYVLSGSFASFWMNKPSDGSIKNIYIQKFLEKKPVNDDIIMGLFYHILFKPIFLYF
jgi:hypothetical protein